MILGMCLLLSTLCVTVFAADAPTAAVLRISGEKKDGKLVHIQDYTVFDDGWNAAMELAINSKELNKKEYTRVVVDLLADWEAGNGEFTDDTWNGKGFNWDAIYFYDEARITLNLNGHTINRGLTSYQYNGEVMYIDEDADVIINGGKIGDPIIAPGEDPGNVQMGTITGGFSCNGAGGIHINDGANVTLNNVCLIGNTVEDDKGSAIALYDGATLNMNGGCLSNNNLEIFVDGFQQCEGVLYVEDSTAELKNVTISGNKALSSEVDGGLVIVMAKDSAVTLDGCLVEDNGVDEKTAAMNIFCSYDEECVLTLKNTDIKNNGREITISSEPSALFSITGTLIMDNDCTVTGNNTVSLFSFYYSECCYANIRKTTFTDNASQIFRYSTPSGDSYSFAFADCTFNNNKGSWNDYTFTRHAKVSVTFTDCDFGDSSFTDNAKTYFTFIDSNAAEPPAVGSLFGGGSLTLIISFAALVASIASISVNLTARKKKASSEEEPEDEE